MKKIVSFLIIAAVAAVLLNYYSPFGKTQTPPKKEVGALSPVLQNQLKQSESVANEYENIDANLKTYEGIMYNPSLGGPTNEKINIPEIVERIGDDAKSIKWLKTKIATTSDTYYVYEDFGPSGDPHFEFYVKKSGTPNFEYKGSTPTGLKIPGNGTLYTKSHSNEIFDAVRMFRIGDNTKLEQINQPLILVGIRTKVNNEVNVHYSTSTKEIVTILKPGSMVDLLAISEDNSDSFGGGAFLALLENGEYGWIIISEANLYGSCSYDEVTRKPYSNDGALRDVCFAGD